MSKLKKLFKEINYLIENNFGQINIKISLTNPNRIKLFFLPRTAFLIKYVQALQIKCFSCNTGYIESTGRMCFSRIQEHLEKFIRTFRPLTNPSHSVIRDHAWNLNRPLNANNISILDSCRDLYSLRILESIYTKIHSPGVNNAVTPVYICTM